MDYLMANKAYLIDTKTFEFVPYESRELPCNITVPYYLWRFNSIREHIEYGYVDAIGGGIKTIKNVYKKVQAVYLNRLEVKFLIGYKHAQIAYYDTKQDDFVVIDIDAYPNLVTQVVGKNRYDDLVSVSYELTSYFGVRKIESNIGAVAHKRPNFQSVTHLDTTFVRDAGDNIFCFGISAQPYTIRYRGKNLNGSSYALVCGPWAVLLSDKLEFDSIVLLQGVCNGVLEVERFAYTVNKYVLKIMTLVR